MTKIKILGRCLNGDHRFFGPHERSMWCKEWVEAINEHPVEATQSQEDN